MTRLTSSKEHSVSDIKGDKGRVYGTKKTISN